MRAIIFGAVVAIAAGCGNEAKTPAVDAADIDADPTPAESCVRPGGVGNANGVGTYCSPGGGQCAPFDLAPLCLADVGQDQWFCTRLGCTATSNNCGAGAGCVIDPAGSACVPCACEPTGIGCN